MKKITATKMRRPRKFLVLSNKFSLKNKKLIIILNFVIRYTSKKPKNNPMAQQFLKDQSPEKDNA
jgi:hypothetical protein